MIDSKDKLFPGDFMLLRDSMFVYIAKFHQYFTEHLFDLGYVIAERSRATRHSRWKIVDAVTNQTACAGELRCGLVEEQDQHHARCAWLLDWSG